MSKARSRLLARATAPASEPVTLAEAKLYLRVDTTTEDSMISDLIVAARMSAESWLNKSLITQAWKLAVNDVLEPCVYLPMGPVTGITSVTIYNRDNTSQIVDSSSYYLNAAKDALMMDSPLFALSVGVGARIEIIYATGYGNASAVPKSIKQGILAHIAALYDGRGEPLGHALPPQSIQLYAPFREVRV